MASSAPVLLLFVGLFTTTVGYEVCGKIKDKSKFCAFRTFCCGTCDNKYCCSDPQKRLTVNAQRDCSLKGSKRFRLPLQRKYLRNDTLILIIVVSILMTSIAILVTCWFSPNCYLHKKFRSPRPENETTEVMMTPYPPQPDIQDGQYHLYQPYGCQPMPSGPFMGQPYQENAGPGYPVPFSQAPHDGGQGMYPIQPHQPPLFPDCTSPQPPYNPAYMAPPGTTLATPVQPVKTSY